ncbi:hypothetical protein ACWC5I_26150 [Kitasatospora sp. NPDC001574]
MSIDDDAPMPPDPPDEATPEPILRIPSADLHRALDVLLRRLADRAPNGEVAVHDDYYWSVPPAGAFDIHEGPPELTIGRLPEAWEHLERMIADETATVGYGLVWLGDLLRAVGAREV